MNKISQDNLTELYAYNYILPKYLITGEAITKLFSIDNFGKKYAGLYHTYIALKIISLQFGNPDNAYWFYRSAKDIGHIARLSEKQIQRYIQVLIRLELILAIKNPGKQALKNNPGLKNLFEEKFKKQPNKPIYFFKVLNLSKETITGKISQAKVINLWFESQYKTRHKAKTQRLKENRDRQLKELEKRINAENQAIL